MTPSGDWLPVGMAIDEGPEVELRLPLSTLLRHGLVTGSAGWGKSYFLSSLLLPILTQHPHLAVVLIDPKGELAALFRDVWLPALMNHGFPVDPSRIKVIAPFSNYGVPLNPLARLPGLRPEVQAYHLVTLISELLPGSLGPRMAPCLAALIKAAMLRGGTLHDIRRLLTSPHYAVFYGSQLPESEERYYLLQTLPTEPASTRDGLRARLEFLLLVPEIAAALGADGCVSGGDLLTSGLTLIDLGNAPHGVRALTRFLGSLLVSLVIVPGIFARQVTPKTPHAIVVVDEWHELVRVAADEIDQVLALARSQKVALWLANQGAAQIAQVSPALLDNTITNTAFQVAFRPDEADLRPLRPFIEKMVTGRRINPWLPDELLNRQDERDYIVGRLTSLPPQHALFVDRPAGKATLIRSLNVPIEEARARAARVPAAVREQLRRGQLGIPTSTLIAAMEQRERQAARESAAVVQPSVSRPAKRSSVTLTLPPAPQPPPANPSQPTGGGSPSSPTPPPRRPRLKLP